MSVRLPSHILGQAQGKNTRHVVSVSGGKDSTATYLLAYTAPPTSHVCIYAGGLCE